MKRSSDEEITPSGEDDESKLPHLLSPISKRPKLNSDKKIIHTSLPTQIKNVAAAAAAATAQENEGNTAAGFQWKERVRDTDQQMMDALHTQYNSKQVDQECEEIRRRYFVTYMKKVLNSLPMSQEIIDASKSIEEGDEFLKMYSVAKTCVHSDMQLKKLSAFNSVFDMMSHVIGKGLHDRLVAPYLQKVVPKRDLDAAYTAFKTALSSDDDKTSTELHCVAYLIQNEMDKERPLRISNPIFNRFTQQLKAASEYVTTLLQSLASKPLIPHPEPKMTRDEHPNDSTIQVRIPGSKPSSSVHPHEESSSDTDDESDEYEFHPSYNNISEKHVLISPTKQIEEEEEEEEEVTDKI